jgi:hypothetical protein
VQAAALALSALWLFIVGALAVRSFYVEDVVILGRDDDGTHASVTAAWSCRGWIVWHNGHYHSRTDAKRRIEPVVLYDATRYGRTKSGWLALHLGSLAPRWERFGMASYWSPASLGGGTGVVRVNRLFRFHMAYLLLPLAPVAVFVVRRLLQHRVARRRLAAGQCPHCGYDLRASPDRCPECGEVPESAPRPAA